MSERNASAAIRAAGLVLVIAGSREALEGLPMIGGALHFAWDAYGTFGVFYVSGAVLQLLAGWLLARGRVVPPVLLAAFVAKAIAVAFVVRIGVSPMLLMISVGGELTVPAGVLIFLVLARPLDSRTSMRGELAAVLSILGWTYIVLRGWQVWELANELTRNGDHADAGRLAYEAVSFVVYGAKAVFMVLAARALAAGDPRARRYTRIFVAVAVVITVVTIGLTAGGNLAGYVENPFWLMSCVGSAITMAVPLALGVLVSRELAPDSPSSLEATPADDALETPTVFAWGALYVAPLVFARASLAEVVVDPIENDGGTWAIILAVGCGALLLATAYTTYHRSPIAIWLARLQAVAGLVLCAMIGYMQRTEPRMVVRSLPVMGATVLFATSAVLARSLARKGHGVPVDRVANVFD